MATGKEKSGSSVTLDGEPPQAILKPRMAKVTVSQAETFQRNLLRRYAGRRIAAGNFKTPDGEGNG